MTTTKKTTRATTRTTKTTSSKKPTGTAPKAASAEPTPTPTDDVDNVFMSTMRSGMGALEFATLSAAELPLSVLHKVGVPESATDTAREGGRSMLHGVSGTIDTLASQTFKVAGRSASLMSGVVGSVKP
jgi:hypothetical protein